MPDDLTTTLEPPTGSLELPQIGLELPRAPRIGERLHDQLDRLDRAVRHPRNQRQLVRFLCVGVSGYVVNTVTFGIALHLAGLDYKLAFCVGFICGCANNFIWNRYWTFGATDGHAAKQGIRFLLVSAVVAACAYGVMVGLVHTTGIWKVPADAIAWIVVTPVSFIVQKLWSFQA